MLVLAVRQVFTHAYHAQKSSKLDRAWYSPVLDPLSCHATPGREGPGSWTLSPHRCVTGEGVQNWTRYGNFRKCNFSFFLRILACLEIRHTPLRIVIPPNTEDANVAHFQIAELKTSKIKENIHFAKSPSQALFNFLAFYAW